jgi:hypothetical protein
LSDDQEKIKIAREYFMRADQVRPDILELFQEDAEVYFPKFGSGRNSFLEMVKGFEGALEFVQHDYDRLTFIPSADYLLFGEALRGCGRRRGERLDRKRKGRRQRCGTKSTSGRKSASRSAHSRGGRAQEVISSIFFISSLRTAILASPWRVGAYPPGNFSPLSGFL